MLFRSDGINGELNSNPSFAFLKDRKQVRDKIDTVFIRLMRLGAQAKILGYSVSGQTLTVNYSLPAH